MPNSPLESIYYKLPVALQNAAFSLHGFRLRRQRYNRHFRKQLVWLKESEWWSKDQIRDYQNEQFCKIVHHAVATVPFYRDFYSDQGVDLDQIRSIEDVQRLPILTKQMVRENQGQLVSNAYNPAKLAKGLTSGTSGTPVRVCYAPEGQTLQWAIWWRHRARFGLTIDDRHLVFGARVAVPHNQKNPPFWRYDAANQRSYLSTQHVIAGNLQAIVDHIDRSNFKFFTGYPSAMFVLANLMDEANIRFQSGPEIVVTGSDALAPPIEAKINKVFGAPVTEQYGMVEFAGNISKCERGMFHVDVECGHVEVEPLPNSQYGRLLLTGWGNKAMPFIRYEVGDYAITADDPCGCGRMSPCLVSVDGRTEDYILTPDNRRVIGLNQVLEYAPNAIEIQIYQPNREEIEVRVVPTEQFGDEDRNAIVRELRRRVGDDLEISFRPLDSLVRSKTGKFKAVISDIEEAKTSYSANHDPGTKS